MTGAVGVCLPTDCGDDDDCEEPTPICDATLDPDQCVQCVGDDDCDSPLVFDSSGTRSCVECVDDDG